MLSCVVEAGRSKEPSSYYGKNFSEQIDHFIHSDEKYIGARELYWSFFYMSMIDMSVFQQEVTQMAIFMCPTRT